MAKYMGRLRQPPSQTGRTFLRNHVGQIVAADFFVVPTATYRLLFLRVLLAHDRPRIRHVAVTAHPTAAWTTQQLREAFPWDKAPRYLLHDRDHAFERLGTAAKAMAIEEVLTAPRSPWQNAFVERFIGSVRRECLDHVIVFNEADRALEIAARFPQASTAVLARGEIEAQNVSRLRARTDSDDTHATYRVAAFQTFLSGRI